jgi:hypothetical protein
MPEPREAAEQTQPFLAAAFICEKVVPEGDHSVSITRIIDTTEVAAETNVQRGTTVVLPLELFIMFRTGKAAGKRNLELRLTNPSGYTLPIGREDAEFSGEPPETGTVYRVDRLEFVWDTTGLYWFEILLDGVQLTRVPLRMTLEENGSSPAS